jgi:hypothetical protein
MDFVHKRRLKGPVWRVRTTRSAYDSRTSYKEEVYDRDGRIVSEAWGTAPGAVVSERTFRYTPDGDLIHTETEISRDAEGSRIETTAIAGAGAWSMPWLHGFAFGTWGAAIGRTRFAADGMPVETRSEDHHHRAVATVVYSHDGAGRITEAVQVSGERSGASHMASIDVPERFAAATGGSGELGRVTFAYDGSGQVTEVRAYLLGQPVCRNLYEYNDNGDVVVSTEEHALPARFEYQYDAQKNWTTKRIHHGLGVDVEARTIAYYDL